ncbi:BamA/TamA family outer membrane protein [Tenacibaculum tangerinum]|uniref:BamA/TamA family outer membrane protein n=1 Tax=Tenacibaculum tangerinum TaxID=3038772 RepID=A0ABY8KZQ2_9FLAO|nr:BamA/TamA family outer membrane protein [Tenacibaculum tangerinum]WGH74711.1 BamA/TamA family outer membrane protein [Tenacibaculum tangerinum]
MKKHLTYYLQTVFLAILLGSCSVQKYIPENERLYTGAAITIEADSTVQKVDELKTELEKVLRPEPNSTFLGMRLGLFYYYKNQQEKTGFINRWLYKKFGEEPVYQSDVKTYEVEDLLQNRLYNRGFFFSSITNSFQEQEKEAEVSYKIKVPAPYTIGTFQLDTLPLPIYNDVKQALVNSPIKNGMRFDLSSLKQERKRVHSQLMKKGYYNFNPDFLVFEADTNRYDNRKFDLFLKLKAKTPQKAIIPYRLENINIYTNKNVQDSTKMQVERFHEKNYFQNSLFFKPKHLDKFITLKNGMLYDPEISKNTARRLSSIGAYKYVNIQYNELDSLLTDSIASLEANIYLSPLTKRALQAELQVVTKSNNFTGPNLALTYSNRNLFKGGETLNISTNIGYETQFASGSDAGLNSIELGLKGELIFPRLIEPFGINDAAFKYAIPKTKTSLGLDYLSRSKLYKLLSANALFGYTWDANRYTTYEFNPISLNYTSLLNSSEEFETILENNPFLKRSFEQQFIFGLTFSYIYNEMIDANKQTPFYLQTTLDVAGNAISLLSKQKNEGEPKQVFGLEYAQYAKLDVDARLHFNFGKNNRQTLATRLFAGYGLAYGNSDVVPFVKQYFSGGPYSVRAFRIRSLGPGTYNENEDELSDGTFFDQTGNIRLEANAEYRFPIVSFFKGAFFVDAGNVWNSKPNPLFNGKDTFSSNFINELGIGAGAGLRIDVQGFVVRFDLAVPLHDPSLPKQERWDFQADKSVLNFAIGYSF